MATTTLPPGPRWPDLAQAILLMRFRPTTMTRLRRRHGPVFRVRMPYGPHGSMVTVVVLTDPAHIREVFAGPVTTFRAGEGNSALLDIMGENSLLILDEDAHARARKLVMPAFTARALAGYREMVSTLARAEVDRWSDGQRLRSLDQMHAITLEVILQVVFGVTDQDRLDELRPLVRRVANVNLTALLSWRYRGLQRFRPWSDFAAAQGRLDEVLYAEIAERRRDPALTERPDLLSRLLLPDDAGDTLSDGELRDQLVTFLLAGHETTSTALAWTLHELARHPDVLARALAAADTRSAEGDAYLDAVVKETMRLRPVIYDAARTLTQPIDLAGYRLPAGVVVSPALGLVGIDEALHAQAGDFDPGRFLGRAPAPNTWIPFGGGPRRCIGAAFSQMEAVEVLCAVLARYSIEPDRRAPEHLRPRGIINEPHRGGAVVLHRRD